MKTVKRYKFPVIMNAKDVIYNMINIISSTECHI